MDPRKFLLKAIIRAVLFTIMILSTRVGLCQDGFVNGTPSLAYWEVGGGEDVVIILHGGPCASHTYLRPEFDALSEVARLVYYDQRGCGKSDAAQTYYWQDHVEDLHRVVNQFTDNHEVFLAGSSWGSILALLYANRYPYGIKGVILSGTVPWRGVGQKLEEIPWAKIGMQEIGVYEHQITEYHSSMDDTVHKDVDQNPEISRTVSITSGPPNTNTLWSLRSAPPFHKLESISQPPFLIFKGPRQNSFGLNDWGHVYDAILPKSELVEMKNAGHDPWLADPQFFFMKAKEFIIDHQ